MGGCSQPAHEQLRAGAAQGDEAGDHQEHNPRHEALPGQPLRQDPLRHVDAGLVMRDMMATSGTDWLTDEWRPVIITPPSFITDHGHHKLNKRRFTTDPVYSTLCADEAWSPFFYCLSIVHICLPPPWRTLFATSYPKPNNNNQLTYFTNSIGGRLGYTTTSTNNTTDRNILRAASITTFCNDFPAAKIFNKEEETLHLLCSSLPPRC
uniref:Uncharacterized protein n=1 Tax=Timema douglasi TaxID=61478 RepID=A0A7R8ZFE9_TIMDO|nr:unnamed protein product [Timema douglasi]